MHHSMAIISRTGNSASLMSPNFYCKVQFVRAATAQNAGIAIEAIANKLHLISPYITQLKYRRKRDLFLK